MSQTTTDPKASIARLYLQQQNDGELVVTIAGTSYQIHLACDQPVEKTPQSRVYGVIACPVWKVDKVSKGGSYIEPVMGRPRRIQGKVIGADPTNNSVIVEVCGCPVVGQLPDRWTAANFTVGQPIALDVSAGSTFSPVEAPA